MTRTQRKGPERGRWFLGSMALLVLIASGVGVWWSWSGLSTDPIDPARLTYEQGDYDLASEIARERLRADRDDLDALRILARIAARRGEYASAQRIYQRIGADAMLAEDLYLLGVGLLSQGNDELAWGALELAESKGPDHPETLRELSRLHLEANHAEQAAGYAERLLALPGWEAAAGLLIGQAQRSRLDTAGAAEALTRAFQADPELSRGTIEPTEARKLLARALLAERRPGEARRHLEAIEAPEDEVHWLLSRALLQAGDIDAAALALTDAGGFADDDPTIPEPAPYVGSLRCIECHSTIYQDQQSSRHAQTFRRQPGPDDLPPLPAGPIVDPHNPDVVHEFHCEGDRLAIETRARDRAFRAVVAFAMGSGKHGLTMVGHDQNGQLRELRLTHYAGVGWDRTTGLPQRPDNPAGYLGEPLTADAHFQCLGCHTTNTHTIRSGEGPTAHDRAIGCERCHGPAGHHLLAVEAGFPELAIAQPRHASAEQVVQLCGQCHRAPDGAPVGPSDHPSAVRFQATTFVRSPCYTQGLGRHDCVTCHDPHRNVETNPAHYEAVCLSCHQGPESHPGTVVVAAKPRLEPNQQVPCPVNPAQNCISCHMPKRPSQMSHTDFTDHHIRVHPDLAEAK
ncbi:hypothetical protein BH23PLA1_BH23PLA1_40670 [soil metagenome]